MFTKATPMSPLTTAVIVITAVLVIGLLVFALPRAGSDFVRKLSFVLAFIGTTFPLGYILFTRLPIDPPRILMSNVSIDERIALLEGKVKHLDGTLSAIDKELAQPASGQANGAQSISPAALTSIDQRLIQNTEAIQKFESLLVTDASRLVTLPLMQRDFQAIKDDLISVKDNLTGLRVLVSETGNQNRWVIGTLALGMLGLLIPAVKSLITPGTKNDR